jgi:hypothetical protein
MAEAKKAAGGRLFHVLQGESLFMYRVDMDVALTRHSDEWKDRPWTEEEIAEYLHKAEAAPPAETEPEPEPEPEQPEPEADHDETQSRRRGRRK